MSTTKTRSVFDAAVRLRGGLIEIDDGRIQLMRGIDVADQPAPDVLIRADLAKGPAFERERLGFKDFNVSHPRVEQ